MKALTLLMSKSHNIIFSAAQFSQNSSSNYILVLILKKNQTKRKINMNTNYKSQLNNPQCTSGIDL